MVQDSRKTPRLNAGKSVKTPEPVPVEEDAAGKPVVVRLARRRDAVTDIEDRWRIDDEWWRREALSRFYYEIVLDSGLRLVLYKDLIRGGWYRQSY